MAKSQKIFSSINLKLIEENGVSKVRIHKDFPSGDYVWKIPQSIDTG